jgi:hypothetical protein
MYLSFIHLFFPLNMTFQKYYLHHTKNIASLVSAQSIIECALFIAVVLWIYYDKKFRIEDPHNLYNTNDSNVDETFMVNLLWYIHCTSSVLDADQCSRSHLFRLDILLAMVGFLTWLKLFFYLRNTKTFGPLFKMMEHMIVDLSKFMVIWLVIIIMFACVGILMFGELEAF